MLYVLKYITLGASALCRHAHGNRTTLKMLAGNSDDQELHDTNHPVSPRVGASASTPGITEGRLKLRSVKANRHRLEWAFLRFH